MNIYILIPLTVTIAFIFLLTTALSSRPWRRQNTFFVLFLLAAAIWSIMDFVSRSHFLPHHSLLVNKILLINFLWVTVQFHCFTALFLPAYKERWLPIAYGTLIVNIIVISLGYMNGLVFVILFVPLVVLPVRNIYVLLPRLKNQENPVIRNQTFSLLLSLAVLVVFNLAALLPVSRQIPFFHLGNIIIAIILSYTIVGRRLSDIRFVLRWGLVWTSIGLVGVACYLGLLLILHTLLNIELTSGSILVSTVAAILTVFSIYRLRVYIARVTGKAFQGESFYYRQKLMEFANNIHNIFSLKEQGGKLLNLVIRAVECRKAGLLFLDALNAYYDMQFLEAKEKDNSFSTFKLRRDSPIVDYLDRERIPLTRENREILPEFLGLWKQEKEIIENNEVELFMPLISRDKLIGILVLDKKKDGHYTLEDLALLENVTNHVSVSMEKEYLYAESERMARVDELTGLLNRRSLDEILSSEINRHSRYGSVFSLLIIDLDSLKCVNDNYGHLKGDELLRKIGNVMKNTIREADQAFRYGGDEFAIFLPQTPGEVAFKVAERIRQQVSTRVAVDSNPVTVSLGIASWPTDGVGARDIIAAADAALYKAKRDGGNRSACSGSSISDSSFSAQDTEALKTEPRL